MAKQPPTADCGRMTSTNPSPGGVMDAKKEALVRPWSMLPLDLLKAITEHLLLYSDQVRFYSTCRTWQPVIKLPDLGRGLPWLLLPYDDNTKACGFYNLLDKKVYHLDLPLLRGRLCRGSSHGWVATVEDSPAIRLINPLTRVQIELPPRSKFPDVKKYHANKIGEEYTFWDASDHSLFTRSSIDVQTYLFRKIILSSCPSSGNDFVAVAIYGEFSRLAYCKRGDKKWLHLDRRGYNDIIFYEGKVYALAFGGELLVYEFGPPLKVTELMPCWTGQEFYCFRYLVEHYGEILMVARSVKSIACAEYIFPSPYSTRSFFVFKLDLLGSKWSRVTNIGGDALFLGYNYSTSIPVSALAGCKGNSVYFTDDYEGSHLEGTQGGFDMGVFNLEDGSIEPLPGYSCDSRLVWPPPVWVVPHPY